LTNLEPEYQTLLIHIKQYYQKAQLKAAYAVNREMIQFYWQLGRIIIEKQVKTIWGSKFLEQLSKDLQAEFPGTAGFSVRNLKYMRKFAQLYSEIGQQPVAQFPWGHIIVLMEKIETVEPCQL
jgi:predicted nuclease of restriction endonuclease-like (RecB) superfamily